MCRHPNHLREAKFHNEKNIWRTKYTISFVSLYTDYEMLNWNQHEQWRDINRSKESMTRKVRESGRNGQNENWQPQKCCSSNLDESAR